MEETHAEKISRIDANVQILLSTLPQVQKLDKESAINKREHRIATWFVGIVCTPVVLWACKKLGIPIF